MTRHETIKGTPGLRRFRAAVVAVVLALFMPLALPLPAMANSPDEVQLSYDTGKRMLEVRITHPVSSPQRHYVEKVQIVKNGKPVGETEYKSQPPDQGSYSYFYPLDAAPGDALEAKAVCNIIGSKTGKLTVR